MPYTDRGMILEDVLSEGYYPLCGAINDKGEPYTVKVFDMAHSWSKEEEIVIFLFFNEFWYLPEEEFNKWFEFTGAVEEAVV